MLLARLNGEQRAELDKAVAEADSVRLYRRLKTIDLADRDYSVQEIAKIFDLCDATVRTYIHDFEKGGPGALRDAPRSGRPRKLPQEYDGSEQAQANWKELLDRRPKTITELETNSAVWTLSLLVKYMKVFHQVGVSDQTIHHALTRADLRRGRTKLSVISPDPEYEVKRQRIEDLVKGPGREN
jgi:transposase